MPRLNIEQIGNNGNPANAGNTWMDKLKDIIGTVKETAQIVKEVRQLESGGIPTGTMQGVGGNWGKFLTKLIESGYGDKPIGQLITEIAPYTVKQLIQLAANGGKNEAGNSE